MSTVDGKHIMFSYAWRGGHQKVDRIARKFRSVDIPIWMDTRNGLGDDLIDGMAEAVEDSLAVCCFITPEYQESKYCERELKYASQLDKPIIPCFLADFQPRKWLGLLTAGLIRYDFSDGAKDDMLNALIRYVQRDILKVKVKYPHKPKLTIPLALSERNYSSKTGAGERSDSDEEESVAIDHSSLDVFLTTSSSKKTVKKISPIFDIDLEISKLAVNQRSRTAEHLISRTDQQKIDTNGSQDYKKYL